MDRRRFLTATCGAGVALAGCVGGPTGGQSNEVSVEVDGVALQFGVVKQNTPDSMQVFSPGAPQLYVSVAAENVDYDEFRLRAEDVAYMPERVDEFHVSVDFDRWYSPPSGRGQVLFRPSAWVSSSLALGWPGDERALDDTLTERLDGRPDMTAQLSVPATYDGSDVPPVDVEVTNHEDVERRFVGVLNRSGPRVASIGLPPVTELVPAGEQVRIEYTEGWSLEDPPARRGVDYRLSSNVGWDSARVELEEQD
jgi:hypothetical protein